MSPDLIIILILMPLLLTAVYAGFSAAPWVPTKRGDRRHILERLELQPGQICYDLGCGDGSVLFALARRHPEVIAIGYEVSLLPYLIARARKLWGHGRYRNVSIRFGDLFRQDISDADVIFVFLLAKCYPRLQTKFAGELRDDAQVICEAWPMPETDLEDELRAEKLLPVFFYRGSSFR